MNGSCYGSSSCWRVMTSRRTHTLMLVQTNQTSFYFAALHPGFRQSIRPITCAQHSGTPLAYSCLLPIAQSQSKTLIACIVACLTINSTCQSSSRSILRLPSKATTQQAKIAMPQGAWVHPRARLARLKVGQRTARLLHTDTKTSGSKRVGKAKER